MKTITLFSALILSAPALAQTQSGTQPTSPGYVHPTPVSPNWVRPLAPGQTSSNPWATVESASPYKHMYDEIRAASNPALAPTSEAACNGQTKEGCDLKGDPPKE